MSLSRYWTPFVGTENNELRNARQKYLAKGKCRVLDTLTPFSLSFMYPQETLIINGHGRSRSLILAENEDGTGRCIDIKTTAAWLRHADLPKNHVRIRILGCESEGFARILAVELGSTHPQIVVGGYKYSIYVGDGHRSLISRPDSYWPVANTTNSGNVVWFNAQGKAVDKPQGKLEELMYDPYLDTCD